MSQLDTLQASYRLIHEKGHWIEPVAEVLKDIEISEAQWRPAKDMHSIEEIVNHMAYWIDWTTRSMRGESLEPLKPMPEPGHAPGGMPNWPEARANLNKLQDHLLETISDLSEAELERHLKHWECSIAELINALLAHQAYHVGQIHLLKQLWMISAL